MKGIFRIIIYFGFRLDIKVIKEYFYIIYVRFD
ncbi:hypothetical protein LCGC14_0640660, partial [marine sediment metagenome]